MWSPVKEKSRKHSDEINIDPEGETALRVIESEKHLVEGSWNV